METVAVELLLVKMIASKYVFASKEVFAAK